MALHCETGGAQRSGRKIEMGKLPMEKSVQRPRRPKIYTNFLARLSIQAVKHGESCATRLATVGLLMHQHLIHWRAAERANNTADAAGHQLGPQRQIDRQSVPACGLRKAARGSGSSTALSIVRTTAAPASARSLRLHEAIFRSKNIKVHGGVRRLSQQPR